MGRAIIVGVLLVLAACARTQAPRQSDAMERSARLLERLDQLEADLHQQDAHLFLASELEWRHGQVAQVACRVSEDHLREIHRLASAQEEKQRERSHKRKAIAQARTKAPRIARN